jgi:hypothetical protein
MWSVEALAVRDGNRQMVPDLHKPDPPKEQ